MADNKFVLRIITASPDSKFGKLLVSEDFPQPIVGKQWEDADLVEFWRSQRITHRLKKEMYKVRVYLIKTEEHVAEIEDDDEVTEWLLSAMVPAYEYEEQPHGY